MHVLMSSKKCSEEPYRSELLAMPQKPWMLEHVQ